MVPCSYMTSSEKLINCRKFLFKSSICIRQVTFNHLLSFSCSLLPISIRSQTMAKLKIRHAEAIHRGPCRQSEVGSSKVHT